MGFFSRTEDKPPTAKQAADAAAVLGLMLDGITDGVVRAAFRSRAQGIHPDTSAAAEQTAERLHALIRARAQLLCWIESLPEDGCPLCRGKGFVRRGIVVKPCTRCQT